MEPDGTRFMYKRTEREKGHGLAKGTLGALGKRLPTPATVDFWRQNGKHMTGQLIRGITRETKKKFAEQAKQEQEEEAVDEMRRAEVAMIKEDEEKLARKLSCQRRDPVTSFSRRGPDFLTAETLLILRNGPSKALFKWPFFGTCVAQLLLRVLLDNRASTRLSIQILECPKATLQKLRTNLATTMKTRNDTRASKGLPRKRPSYDLDDLRPPRPKKQRRSPPRKKFPLMKLPAEIRLKILRELLWHPEPLKFFHDDGLELISPPFSLTAAYRTTGEVSERTNYAFHPAILAVCRKLNDEGTPVLYEENTMDVAIKQDPFYPHDSLKCEWMGSEGSLRRVSETLSAKARRLQITIQASSSHEINGIRAMLRNIVETLQANPQWCSLNICLDRLEPEKMTFDQWSEQEDVMRVDDEQILKPLSLLRRLKDVDFSGVSPEVAPRLIKTMKSDSLVVDLPKMFNNLEYYADDVFANDPLESQLDEAFGSAYEAMDEGNEAEFYKQRDKVMWEIDKIRSQEIVDVFKDDPEPIVSRLHNHDFITIQGRVESQQTERRLAKTLQKRIAETQEHLRLRKELLQQEASRESSNAPFDAEEILPRDGTIRKLEEHIAKSETLLKDSTHRRELEEHIAQSETLVKDSTRRLLSVDDR